MVMASVPVSINWQCRNNWPTRTGHKNVAPNSTSGSDVEEELVEEEDAEPSLLVVNPALLLDRNRPQQCFEDY
jgi:hypothetical protein